MRFFRDQAYSLINLRDIIGNKTIINNKLIFNRPQ